MLVANNKAKYILNLKLVILTTINYKYYTKIIEGLLNSLTIVVVNLALYLRDLFSNKYIVVAY